MSYYVIGGVAVTVGALAFGVPLPSLAVFLFLLACPLMMIVMMSGMHGAESHGAHRDENNVERESRPSR